MTLTYHVIEDNGGGLHLAVFDKTDSVIYWHSGYECCQGQLTDDIITLKNESHLIIDAWDGNADDPQGEYDRMTQYEFGWNVVADEDGIEYDLLGAAGEAELTIKLSELADFVRSKELKLAPGSNTCLLDGFTAEYNTTLQDAVKSDRRIPSTVMPLWENAYERYIEYSEGGLAFVVGDLF